MRMCNYIYPLNNYTPTALRTREYVGLQSPWRTERWGPSASVVLLKINPRYVEECLEDGRLNYTASKQGYVFPAPSPAGTLDAPENPDPWRTFAAYTGIPRGNGTVVLASAQEVKVWFRHPNHLEYCQRTIAAADLS